MTGETILNVFESKTACTSNLVHSFQPLSNTQIVQVYTGPAVSTHLYVFESVRLYAKYQVVGTVKTRAEPSRVAICHTLPAHAQVAAVAIIYLSFKAGEPGGVATVTLLTAASECEVITPYTLK